MGTDNNSELPPIEDVLSKGEKPIMPIARRNPALVGSLARLGEEVRKLNTSPSSSKKSTI